MITGRKISKSTGSEFKPLPADMYQIQITDVEEREGFKFGSTTEKVVQFMFKAEVVEGDETGGRLVIFTSQSWFGGGGKGSSRASKLFDLCKAVYGEKSPILAMDEITDKEINGLVGKQLRVTVQVTESDRNKVTGFLPIKKEIPYTSKKAPVDPDLGVEFN